MQGGAKETDPRLVHCRGSEVFGVAYDKLLRPRIGERREAWHTRGRKSVENARIIEVVIKRPVAGFLVDKIHTLANLVVLNPRLLTVVRIGACERITGHWDIRKKTDGGSGPGRCWNRSAWKDTAVRGTYRISPNCRIAIR